ncbi:MAG TPA: Rieske 2Fe-2S domain-containing protein, partial [Candidatus Krumholzibacteria bacterium]|nr:Rieske 2Fe-2S domain-containing protein [Candidatus Krumholzibacteria bacterium]
MPQQPQQPERWIDAGDAAELSQRALQQIVLDGRRIALSYREGEFGAVSGNCNHAGGPLGEGLLEGDLIVCPWHQWRFHRIQGHGEPGFEEDAVPAYRVRVHEGRVQISAAPFNKRKKKPHEPHPLTRDAERASGPPRVVGISTTVMSADYPRYSTSDALLEEAL